MADMLLQCGCGKVKGSVCDVSPSTSNRVVCYCKDCQAFAQALNRESDVLNEFGGTDIIQFPPSVIHIKEGAEQIRCLRLSENGLNRWYAGCCNTPIGNTAGPSWPFIGVINSFIAPAQDVDTLVGPSLGALHINGATGRLTAQMKGPNSTNKIVLIFLRKLLTWKLKGMTSPSPLYNNKGEPIVTPEVVSPNDN